jgi:two-component sensor histidine kinase
LQAGSIQHPGVQEILRESHNRVQSVAIVHDLLHRSKDLSRIDFAEYVRSLVASLICSYGVSSDTVSLRVDVEPVSLAIDTAIPCGLIIHELITNALKYAFPDGRRGEIRVSLKPAGGKRLRLTVSDDGVGFAEGARPGKAKSLGLRLVRVLAEQIGSTVESPAGAGARFDFEFEPQM